MKKRIANVVEIVMIIISYGMMWLPLVKVQYVKLIRQMPLSTSPMGLNPKGTVYIITIICVINVIMCLFSVFTKKEYRDGKFHIFMPIVMFLYNMASMNVSGVGKTIGEWVVVENKIPSKLFLICMISVIAISILKRSALIVGLPKVEVQNFPKNIDESQKDLLDNGKITQENFDKKQFHNQ